MLLSSTITNIITFPTQPEHQRVYTRKLCHRYVEGVKFNFVDCPIDNEKCVIWFMLLGRHEDENNAKILNGNILNDIPAELISKINDGLIHVIIDTAHESYSPVYAKNKIFSEGNLHVILTDKADELGIDKKQITWLTGDLKAEKHVGDDFINIKSIWAYLLMQTGHPLDELADQKPPTDFKSWGVSLNSDPKHHRIYLLSKLWHLKKKMTDNVLWKGFHVTMPRYVHENKTICDGYTSFYHDFKHDDQVDLSVIRDNILDIYAQTPIVYEGTVAEIYNQCGFTIVTESWAYGEGLFLSKATIDVIKSGIPALIVGHPGTLAYIRNQGFKTFGNIFDESYDDELNMTKRIDMIVSEVERLANDGVSAEDLRKDVESIRIHNQSYFKHFVKDQHDQYIDWLLQL